MQLTSFTTGAAVLLALAPSVFAGTAHVINNCGVPIYYQSVAAGVKPADMVPIPQGGFSQTYGADNIGISIKLSPQAGGKVSQFEFTPSGNTISYDLSNIDGFPFAKGGMQLMPSAQASKAFPSCVPVTCAAGDSVCEAAYNAPDDTRTLVCGSTTDLTLTLCQGGSMKREEVAEPVERVHARQFPKLA